MFSMLLFAGNVLNTLLVTTSSKFCVEELVEALTAHFFADETTLFLSTHIQYDGASAGFLPILRDF